MINRSEYIPVVAEINKQNALTNIKRKIRILEHWINTGIPRVCDTEGKEILSNQNKIQLDYFPTTIRQFNMWDGSQNCDYSVKNIGKFTKNANETLNNHINEKDHLKKILAVLIKTAKAQKGITREESLAKLKGKLSYEILKRKELESEFITQRKALRDLIIENKRLINLQSHAREESHKSILKLEAELNKTKSIVADLRKQLTKVIPLKALD